MDQIMTIEEVAKELGISRALAYDAVRRGEIPVLRVGRRLLVPRNAFDRFLASAELQAPRKRNEDDGFRPAR